MRLSIDKKKMRFVSIFSFFAFTFILGLSLLKSSYAVDGYPTTAFRTNYTNGSVTNLVSNALSGNSTYSSYLHNFEAVTNFRANSNVIYSLMKNSTYPATTEQFELVNNNPTNISDAGLLYILGHGYNSTNSVNTVFTDAKYGAVSDDNIKEYVTQIAIWLYLYEHKSAFSSTYCIDTGYGYNSCDFYIENSTSLISSSYVRNTIKQAASVNGYSYLNYIIELVDGANGYKKTVSSMKQISSTNIGYDLSIEDKRIISSPITPEVTGNSENFMYYSVEIVDPNNYGVYLVDEENKKIENTSMMKGTFKIYVPLGDNIEEMDLSKVGIKIKGSFLSLGGKSYAVTKSTTNPKLLNSKKKKLYADILFIYLPIENVEISLNLRNITVISKVDATTSKELPGATLEVSKKKTKDKVTSWVSTDTPKYIYLEDGDYVLCETIAPEGYQLNKECVNFTVNTGKVTKVVMKNSKIPPTDVPNTGFDISKLLPIIGILVVVAGLGTIGYTLLKKKNKNEDL